MDTLVHDPWREGLAAAFGDRLGEAIEDRPVGAWPAFERGELTEDEFWATWSVPADPEACRAVRVAQTRWIDGMLDLVRDVRAAGHRTVLATNYPVWFEDLGHLGLDEVVDEQVASYRVGARKPDAEFYEAVVAAAGVPADHVVFLDDRDTNVDGAIACGLHASRFVDADTTRMRLREHGLAV